MHAKKFSLIGYGAVFVALLVLLLVLAPHTITAATNSATGSDITYQVKFGGQNRTYIVHIPPNYSASNKYPIMVVYHGNGGTGASIEKKTDFDTVADTNLLFVAYPYGINGSWQPTGQNNDVQFTQFMLQKIEGKYSIDTARIYASGFSEGGGMTQYLVCAIGAQIAGFADVSNNLNQDILNNCTFRVPITGLFFHGTADPISFYNGGNYNGGTTLSANQTGQFWAAEDSCTASTTTPFPDVLNDGSNVTDLKDNWANCGSGLGVTFYTITNGGHTWPGGINNNPDDGLYSMDVIASSIIWQTLSPMHR